MDQEAYDKGLKLRRQVMGDDFVDRSMAPEDDFNKALQDIVIEYGWGNSWGRGGLELKTLSLINIGMLASLKREHEFRGHFRGIGGGDDDDPSDIIYNGAIDNASGTATVLEIARVWSTVEPRPKRSILFAWVAAEEQGLLGSAFLGQNPPIPAGKIGLGINLDALNLFGPVTKVTMIGSDRLTFTPTIENVTKVMNLTIVPDQAPEQGSYYRSDHFSLAKAGVPAFSVRQGSEVAGKPGHGEAMSKLYREKHYHQPSDEFDPAWDFSSAVQMGQLSFWLGWEAANTAQLPMWLEGEEFYAKTREVRSR